MGGSDGSSEWDMVEPFVEPDVGQYVPVAIAGLPTALSSNTSKAGQIVAALEKISDTLREANLLDEIGLSFPEIVVVGQESTGKSSVLERVLGLPLFPRGADIVTRMAIRLKLSHLDEAGLATFCETESLKPDAKGFYIRVSLLDASSNAVKHQTKFEGPYDPTAGNLHSKRPADRIYKLMMEQVTTGGVCEDKVLQVEIKAQALSNLTLLDLPGVVGGSVEGEPGDMAERTCRLVARYLLSPDTLVLVVAEATASSIRNSLAFQLVADAKKTTKACGVLTNSDGCVGPSLARLRERLTGQAKDLPTLGFGYIGVVNRDSRDPEQNQTSIDVAASAEASWFKGRLPDLAAANGGPVLVQKLVTMLEDYVKHSWADKALQLLRSERIKVQAKLESLGPPVEGPHAQRTALDDIVATYPPLFARATDSGSQAMNALDEFFSAAVGGGCREGDSESCLNRAQMAAAWGVMGDRAEADTAALIRTLTTPELDDGGGFRNPLLHHFGTVLAEAGQSPPLIAARFPAVPAETIALLAGRLGAAAPAIVAAAADHAARVKTQAAITWGAIACKHEWCDAHEARRLGVELMREPMFGSAKCAVLAAIGAAVFGDLGSPAVLVDALLSRRPLEELMKEDEATQRLRAKLNAALTGLDDAMAAISSITGRPAEATEEDLSSLFD